MMKRRDFLRVSAGGLVAAPFVKTSAFAADYPTKPVRWLVGYVPGGTTDILARLIGQYLSEKTGQQFIIENKAGAGNNLAVEAVLAAPAGRLHRAAGQSGERHQRDALQEAVVQFRPRHRAGRRPHAGAERHGGQQRRAGEDGQGVHRLRQGQSGQGQHGVVRQRHLGASVGRTVHGDDRREDDPCAVSRLQSRADRPHGRPVPGAVRQHAVVDRADQRRQDPRARGHHRKARQLFPGSADARRNGEGL